MDDRSRRRPSTVRAPALALSIASVVGCQTLLVFTRDNPAAGADGGSEAGEPSDALVRDDASATTDGPAPGDAGFDANGYAGLVRSDGPIAYWRLGEAKGTVAVDELGANDGTYNGCDLGKPGALGDGNTAAGFNAGGAWIETTSAFRFAGTRAFTVEAWVYDPGSGGDRYIASCLGGGTGYEIHVRRPGDQLVLARMSGGTLEQTMSAGGSLSAGAFHHVAAVFDGAATFLYVDGVPNGTETSVLSLPEYDASFVIGSKANGPSTDSFVGTIDEVALYDRALKSTEVRAHFEAAAR